jgi:hypothetical protein
MDEPDQFPYYDYFKDSIGQGEGKYYIGIGEPYRTSSRYQRGYGLSNGFYRTRGDGFGNILSSIWRMAFPMIKTSAKKLGSAALDVATNVASDALAGKDIKDSAKEHLTNKGVELLQDIKKSTSEQTTSPIATMSTVSSPQPSLAAPPPKQSFRRLARKRTGKVTFASPASRPKQVKYPALKHF